MRTGTCLLAVLFLASPLSGQGDRTEAAGRPREAQRLRARLVRALSEEGDTLYCAGQWLAGANAGKPALLALSAADGKTLQTVPLDSRSTADGLAVAGGRLYLATQDGKVLCFGKRQ